jgi:hypothetical protein
MGITALAGTHPARIGSSVRKTHPASRAPSRPASPDAAVATAGALLLLGLTIFNERLTRSPVEHLQSQSRRASRLIDAGLRNAEVVSALGIADVKQCTLEGGADHILARRGPFIVDFMRNVVRASLSGQHGRSPTNSVPSLTARAPVSLYADVIAVQHGTEEPALRVVEDRDVLRSGVPGAPFELVDPVAGFAAEQPGDFGMRPRH